MESLDLKVIRKELGLTQIQMGYLLQISQASIAKYESGEIKPSGDTQKRLSTLAVLMNDKNSKEWIKNTIKNKDGIPAIAGLLGMAIFYNNTTKNATDKEYSPLTTGSLIAGASSLGAIGATAAFAGPIGILGAVAAGAGVLLYKLLETSVAHEQITNEKPQSFSIQNDIPPANDVQTKTKKRKLNIRRFIKNKS